MTTPKLIDVWRIITLGTFENVGALKKTIFDAGFKIGSWAEDVMNSANFTLATEKREINLARVTPKELGFADGALRTDIYKRAVELGLELCPLEVGPQLRLQYTDQPYLESLQIGMEPQKDSGGHESEFRVAHAVDHHLWLVGDHKHPDDFWGPDEPFIFVKP